MTLLYVFSKAVYFPGSFTKAFFEHLFCRLFGVNIYAADHYITRNALSGHVAMLPAETPSKSFFVCFLPMLCNLFFGFPAFAAGVLTLGFMGVDVIDPLSGLFCPLFIVYCLLYLFGASFLCSLFPYTEDAVHMWKMLYSKDSTASLSGKIFAFLPACLLVAGAYLEKYAIPFLASVAYLVFLILT